MIFIKKQLFTSTILAALLSFVSCTEDEIVSTNLTKTKNTALKISVEKLFIEFGEEFVLKATKNNIDVTSSSIFYIDNEKIEGNKYLTQSPGSYRAHAEYVSNNIKTSSRKIELTTKRPPSKKVVLFNDVTFYHEFIKKVTTPVPSGMIRIHNTAYVKKLGDDVLDQLDGNMEMLVTLNVACDNYDRLGYVTLDIVKKGKPRNKINRLGFFEIGRIVTPFMDKNKTPDFVDYHFDVSNVSKILSDPEMRSKYDFWLEFKVTGNTSAGQKEIAGCAGSKETFYGTLSFIVKKSLEEKKPQYLYSLGRRLRFNNFNPKNTDIVGQTVRTFTIELDKAINDASLYIITSNHGANQGGEEYNRRDHFLFFDNKQIAQYKPGGLSCEPFRRINTQANGIYSQRPRTDEQWASFSNWCPGDKIPTRVFELGNLTKGTHTFKISVPDAEFVEKQGNIPLSAYVQGNPTE